MDSQRLGAFEELLSVKIRTNDLNGKLKFSGRRLRGMDQEILPQLTQCGFVETTGEEMAVWVEQLNPNSTTLHAARGDACQTLAA